MLIQRDEKLGLEFPGYWTLLGGFVKEQDAPQAAIRRELQEELSIIPEVTLWKVYERPHHRLINDKIIVIEQHVYTGQISLNASEIVLNEGTDVKKVLGAKCQVKGENVQSKRKSAKLCCYPFVLKMLQVLQLGMHPFFPQFQQ